MFWREKFQDKFHLLVIQEERLVVQHACNICYNELFVPRLYDILFQLVKAVSLGFHPVC